MKSRSRGVICGLWIGMALACERPVVQAPELPAARQEIDTLKERLREAEAENAKKGTALEQQRVRCAEVEAELAQQKADAEQRPRPSGQKIERAAKLLTLPAKLATGGIGTSPLSK